MAKKFISFLGTGNYQECSYKFQNTIIDKVRYIQEALIKIHCQDFTEEDSLCFLLTQEAWNQHWQHDEKNSESLQAIIVDTLKNREKVPKINPISIENGKNEVEIWNIFNKIYENLEDNDTVIFDITHGFRSLPMLFLSVLTYATYLKNITVAGIYYGAFEARDENGIAPIFDLTEFYELMQWGGAANSFINYGYSDMLSNLIKKTTRDHHGSSGAGDALTRALNNLNTVRGSEITEGKIFLRCIERIDKLNEYEKYSAHPAFKPFLEQIKKKFTSFKKNDPLNFLEATKLQLKHGREQQAITLLQEGIITTLIFQQNGDIHNRDLRQKCANLLTAELQKKQNNKILEQGTPVDSPFRQILDKIVETDFFKNIIDSYDKLSNLRNDINHGGYNQEASKAQTIIKNANIYCKEIIEICNKYL